MRSRWPYKLHLVLLLLFFSSCANNQRLAPLQPPPSTQETLLPTRDELLVRVREIPDLKIDFVEVATVLAASQTGIEHPYSTIPRILSPYLDRAKAQLGPKATEEEMVAALNNHVLPFIRSALGRELMWIHEVFGGTGGDCVPCVLLYLISADSMGLCLKLSILPQHVFLYYEKEGTRRNIETTAGGLNLSSAQYQDLFLKSFPFVAFPEDPKDLEKFLAPHPRRHLVSGLLCQGELPKRDLALERDCTDASRLSPDLAYPLILLARHYARGKEFAKAEGSATKAIQASPYDPSLYLARSTFRSSQAKDSLCVEDIEKAITLAPHHARYHITKAGKLTNMGRYLEAVASSSKAIEIAPQVGEYWKNRGALLLLLKKYREAAEDLTRAIELDPRDVDAYADRATTWAMLGDEEKYNADRRKAKELKEGR